MLMENKGGGSPHNGWCSTAIQEQTLWRPFPLRISERERDSQAFFNFWCRWEIWFGPNRTSHPDWVKMFGDFNGQIKLRAKQKFKFLSATSTESYRYLQSLYQIAPTHDLQASCESQRLFVGPSTQIFFSSFDMNCDCIWNSLIFRVQKMLKSNFLACYILDFCKNHPLPSKRFPYHITTPSELWAYLTRYTVVNSCSRKWNMPRVRCIHQLSNVLLLSISSL